MRDLTRIHSISPAEWIVAALGLLLVLSMIGFMTYEAAAGGDAPPAIAVHVDSVTVAAGGYIAHVRASNVGDRTGAAVIVEGRVPRAGSEPEVSQVTFDYVPGRSERHGGLFFNTDPRDGRLAVRAIGYVEP